jgi:hypothetical protein
MVQARILEIETHVLPAWHEVSLLPIHGQQIGDHLPRYGECLLWEEIWP